MGSGKSESKAGLKAQKASARERIAQARAAERRRERVRWIITISVTGVVVAVLVAGGGWGVVASNRPARLPRPGGATGTGLPPWPPPADPASAARARGRAGGPLERT